MSKTPASKPGGSLTILSPAALPRVARWQLRAKFSGTLAAVGSAFFLGMTPIFGKQAILIGLPPLAVVAVRSLLAALLMLFAVLFLSPRALYIYPAGLLGCMIAGWLNGIGSLFYYSALGRIDASVGHLLYSLYPLFLMFWLFLDGQPPSRITITRVILAIPGVYLLTQTSQSAVDWTGVFQMLIAAGFYALHLPINQRVLSDMPAPTVTLYTLIAMSSVVLPFYLLTSRDVTQADILKAWQPLFGLTLVTFLARLMLFIGVKHLGGMQTALIGLGEMIVAVSVSNLWLGEKFNLMQWIGAGLLLTSIVLFGLDRSPAGSRRKSLWLGWLKPPMST